MGSKQASRRAVVVIAAVTKSPKMLAATAVAVMLALALGAAPGLAHGKDRHMPATRSPGMPCSSREADSTSP